MTGETYCQDKELLRGLEEALQAALEDAVKAKYGDDLDELIKDRIREEWHAMVCSDSVADIASMHEITMWLREHGYPYYVDHTAGSSILCYLLGISSVNPLPPHFYCPVCKKVTFDNRVMDGFDLPLHERCDHDGNVLSVDGHDVPWQTFWGYGDHKPLLHINVVKNAYEDFLKYAENSWLLKEAQPKLELRIDYFKNRCVDYSRLEICFSEDSISNGSEVITRIIDASSANSIQALKTVMKSFGAFYRLKTKWFMYPRSFADLLYTRGMAGRSTGNGLVEAFMCRRMGYSAKYMIAFREDVYKYLLEHGFEKKDAWRLSERVRKGRGLLEITSELENAKDKWVLKQIDKTRYLPSKARSLEKVFFSLKMNPKLWN